MCRLSNAPFTLYKVRQNSLVQSFVFPEKQNVSKTKEREESKQTKGSQLCKVSNRLSCLVHLSAAGKESEAMWNVTPYLSEWPSTTWNSWPLISTTDSRYSRWDTRWAHIVAIDSFSKELYVLVAGSVENLAKPSSGNIKLYSVLGPKFLIGMPWGKQEILRKPVNFKQLKE